MHQKIQEIPVIMNSSQSPDRRCQHCSLTEGTLSDYLAYHMCHATIGEAGFAANPDCLAVTILRQLGIEVNAHFQLIENFDMLKRK